MRKKGKEKRFEFQANHIKVSTNCGKNLQSSQTEPNVLKLFSAVVYRVPFLMM
jgi:hypothetical protein